MKRRLFLRWALSSTAGVGLAVTVLTVPLRAQDFQHIGPKQPPKPGVGHIVNEEKTKPLSGHAENEVLVDHLQGVFMVSDPKEVHAEGVTSRRSVEPGDVAFARRPDFAAVIQPYLGQPVTMKSLAELTRSIVAYYRANDRPVVNVYVPQQSITSGFVQVVVLESRLERVDATGQHWFSKDWLLHQVTLRPEQPISAREMRDDLAWINRNPFLLSDFLLAPGDAPGTTDLLLRTQDRFPLRAYAGYENSGNQYTGEDRLLAGFNYGNLFGVGQQLSYQYTQAPSLHEFYAHSGTYIIPLPWHHLLTFFGSYSDTHADLGTGLSSGGVNWQVSARYEIPLPSTAHFTESISAGFDFKRSNNTLAFNVVSISDDNTDVDQFVLSYGGTYLDSYGSTFFSATGYESPGGGLSAYNDDNDYETQRAGARSNYTYGQLALTRITRLPLNFTWTVRGLLQESTANLLPSEELGLGGYETVRGYEEREANGDNGFLASTEVATPPVSLADIFGLKAVKDQLQFLGFVDYGGTSLHQVTPSDVNPNTNLLGVGPGVRYAITPYLSFRFDYGFQLISTGYGTGEHSRANIGVLVSY
jgi:hemolysin activation/secretion protein